MQYMTSPRIEITRKPRTQFEYEYTINILTPPKYRGHAKLQVESLLFYQATNVYPIAREHGILDDDPVAYLAGFYPHADWVRPGESPHQRIGVGTRFLNQIIADCIEEGIKLVHLDVREDCARSFFSKNEFTHFKGHKGDHYYKLISPPIL